MATRPRRQYDVGNAPPLVQWTIVRGDTASFKVYVTDDARQPINVPDWTIDMEIKRPNNAADAGQVTDNATIVMTLAPYQDPDDSAGEFTVAITSAQSAILQTGDIFDIELSLPQNQLVWTVCQGSIVVIEDITN